MIDLTGQPFNNELRQVTIDGTGYALILSAPWTAAQLAAGITALGISGVSATAPTGTSLSPVGFTTLQLRSEFITYQESFNVGNGRSTDARVDAAYTYADPTQFGGRIFIGEYGVGHAGPNGGLGSHYWQSSKEGSFFTSTLAAGNGGLDATGDAVGGYLMMDLLATPSGMWQEDSAATNGNGTYRARVFLNGSHIVDTDGDNVRETPSGTEPNVRVYLHQVGDPTTVYGDTTVVVPNDGCWHEYEIDFALAAGETAVSLGIENVQTVTGTTGLDVANDLLIDEWRIGQVITGATLSALAADANQSLWAITSAFNTTTVNSRDITLTYSVRDQNGDVFDDPNITFVVDSGTITVDNYNAATATYTLTYSPINADVGFPNLDAIDNLGATFDDNTAPFQVEALTINQTWNIGASSVLTNSAAHVITAVVVDQFGSPQTGGAVAMGLTAGSVGSIGATSYDGVTSTYSVTYTPGAVEGTANFVLLDSGASAVLNTSPTKTVDETLVATNVVWAGDSTTTTNGANVTLTAQVVDQDGNPIDDGGTAIITVNAPANGATVSSVYAGNGLYNVTVTAPTTAGSITLDFDSVVDSTSPAITATDLPTTRCLLDIRVARLVSDKRWLYAPSGGTIDVWRLNEVTISRTGRNMSLVPNAGATVVTLYPDSTSLAGGVTSLSINADGEQSPGMPWFVETGHWYVIRFTNNTDGGQALHYADHVGGVAAPIVSGRWAGSATTFAGLPTAQANGDALSSGDIATLLDIDGTNMPGTYEWNGTTWVEIAPLQGAFWSL